MTEENRAFIREELLDPFTPREVGTILAGMVSEIPESEERPEESDLAPVDKTKIEAGDSIMSLADFKVFRLFTGYRFHFILLGVGGTGSELLPKLCRKLNTLRNAFGECLHDISVIDGDIVEEKNLERQNFFKSDLAKNKAETLAMKCSTLFGLNITVYKEYVEEPNRLRDIIHSSTKHPIIIGCVDTAAVRRLIHNFIQPGTGGYSHNYPVFFLDSGNEEFNGQVVLGAISRKDKNLINSHGSSPDGDNDHTDMQETYRFSLPTVCDHYPEMLETQEKFTTNLSCADMAVANPQAADTNVEAATILFQFICNILRGSVEYHKVTFNVVTGNRHVSYNYKHILQGYGIDFGSLSLKPKKSSLRRAVPVQTEPDPMHIPPTPARVTVADMIENL